MDMFTRHKTMDMFSRQNNNEQVYKKTEQWAGLQDQWTIWTC